MKNYLQIMLLISLLFTFRCKTANLQINNVETILIDNEYLSNTRVRLEKNDVEIKKAFDLLLAQAELALTEGPFSVTHKEKLPPSGDKHDYASYSRYWWPDPNKPDGLPYIRKDGETNPASQSLKESDRQRLGAFCRNTETLGLAYYLTGEVKYAKKAAELIRVWFLNTATRMNPNANHAQCRQGHNLGSKSGVLDGRLMVQALEGSLLIENSNELTDDEYKKLKLWVGDYFDWLTNNEMALAEGEAKNNHGSFYDAQAIYFALYADNQKAATEIVEKFFEKRVLSQISPDGSMPEEMARTRPLFYSMYNLHAMLLVAHLAKKLEVDVWQLNSGNSRLQAAVDYLLPYTDPQKKWPEPMISEADRIHMLAILQMADQVFPDRNYLKVTEKLPQERLKVQRDNLAFPLMR